MPTAQRATRMRRARCTAKRGVSGPGRKAGPCPGTITVATSRILARLWCSAAWSVPSGSSAGPSGPHQAWVHAYTSPDVATSVVMSSAVCPGVAMSRTDGVSVKSPGSRPIHRSPS
jgi:hypothetical protein